MNIDGRRTQHMTLEEAAETLRQEFQNRVGSVSLELWTLSDEEAQEMIKAAPVRILLQAFTTTAKFLKKKRDIDLVHYDQNETLELVQKQIEKELQFDSFDKKVRSAIGSSEGAEQLNHRQRHSIRHSELRRLKMNSEKEAPANA